MKVVMAYLKATHCHLSGQREKGVQMTIVMTASAPSE